MFLNITPTITNWTSDNKQFSLTFDENPLADFVELPDDGRAQDELWFSNILCASCEEPSKWYADLSPVIKRSAPPRDLKLM